MSNLALFNIAAIEIFHRCIIDFPNEANFTADDVAEVIQGYIKDGSSNSSLLNDLVRNTADWLIREGFLRDVASDDDSISVVLTHKGLNAVNAAPSSISGKKSFSDFFVGGLSSLTKSVAESLMVEFFKNVS